ncbi:hypothetical protein B0T22DRAFT_490578 [Podospora appendiculata]|uniref:FHA domain-containing protein n=1 Tax=Podospora appendiculata TaxID=314037 RepID=A0AAE0XAI8_9PEZI|nr:hypothetical protein B0T22DRAFT_490578 [Podospora appendiculata]
MSSPPSPSPQPKPLLLIPSKSELAAAAGIDPWNQVLVLTSQNPHTAARFLRHTDLILESPRARRRILRRITNSTTLNSNLNVTLVIRFSLGRRDRSSWIIGSGDEADIRLEDDQRRVSSEHLRVSLDCDGRVFLEDASLCGSAFRYNSPPLLEAACINSLGTNADVFAPPPSWIVPPEMTVTVTIGSVEFTAEAPDHSSHRERYMLNLSVKVTQRSWRYLGSLNDTSTSTSTPTQHPRRDAIAILRQAHSALAYMDGQGIAHGDLHAGNILLQSVDPLVVAIADFGAASIIITDRDDDDDGAAHYRRDVKQLGELVVGLSLGADSDSESCLIRLLICWLI